MVCDHCGEHEAEVHLTQIVQNEMTTRHLCARCAAELGVQTAAPAAKLPLTDFLAQMGKGAVGEADVGTVGPCSFCGTSVEDFKRTGRLGCPHCYSVYEPQLRGLLRRIHGATQHVGKVYLPPDTAEADRTARLAGLRRKLQRAVEAEDFERAAELRDQIRALERSAD
jgi:protein arginine kinase activator